MAVEGPFHSHRLRIVDAAVPFPYPEIEVQQLPGPFDVAHREEAAGVAVLVPHVGHVVVLAGEDPSSFVLLRDDVVADKPDGAVKVCPVFWREDFRAGHGKLLPGCRSPSAALPGGLPGREAPCQGYLAVQPFAAVRNDHVQGTFPRGPEPEGICVPRHRLQVAASFREDCDVVPGRGFVGGVEGDSGGDFHDKGRGESFEAGSSHRDMVPESGVLREEAYSEGQRPGAGIYAAHEGVGRRRDAVRKYSDCLPAPGEHMGPHAAAPVHGCLDFKCFRRGDRDQGGGGIDRSEYALYVGVLSIGADPAVAKGMGAAGPEVVPEGGQHACGCKGGGSQQRFEEGWFHEDLVMWFVFLRQLEHP